MSLNPCTLVSLLLVLHVDTLVQLKCHFEYHERSGATSKLYDLQNRDLGPGFCLTNPNLGQKCSKWLSQTTGQELESCYSCEELKQSMMSGDTCEDCIEYDLCNRSEGD